ncbi:sugar transferase [candidate division WS5 bacterium]|uniref:Sugar transferase n=1 Tax=candidate division WS5 bacterium TaxID=2093353 RepID=A0A419DF06_9BACT|nr:MAG: sugar transferase [candidate division WS5 bacterium]
MIREQRKLFIRVQRVIDLFLVTVSFILGYILRDKILVIYPFNLLGKYLWNENLRSISYYAIYMGLLPVLLVIWGGLLSYFGMYKSSGIKRVTEVIVIVLKTTLVGFILFGSYVFMLRMQEDISRLFIGFTFFSAALLISLEKMVFTYITKVLSKRDKSFKSSLIAFRRVLIIGTGKRARKFIKIIETNPDWSIKIVGIMDMEAEKKGEIIEGHEVIGTLDDIPDVINANVVDEVVFIVPRSWLNKIENVLYYCESAGLKVHIAVNLYDLKFSRAKQTDLQGFPLLVFESTPEKLGHLFIKRVIDFVSSGIAIVLLSPVFVVIAVLIKTTSKGPVFFEQARCGLYGRQFILYKFRTMIINAESKLKDILKYNEMDGPVFKMTNDPRVTKIGKWLRKSSLDELPQLWNVFMGDMSLVGPRPPLPSEVNNYDNWQRRRLSMRPGITCLWQASGRNKITDFREWMRLDLEYIDNWSLWLDFKILVKTIPVVFLGIGAK